MQFDDFRDLFSDKLDVETRGKSNLINFVVDKFHAILLIVSTVIYYSEFFFVHFLASSKDNLEF